ncbi:Imm26 family immunity protein [Duganella radicis]|uniref:Imm26 family immunity protein n=1 Tax=Duganella radicis TaxID=551988 RepID=UPI001478B333|nr:Imm26 family immunity protein [Duganella radicis]
MKQSYQEGSWFAVPLLDGGYGWGLVARLSPGSKIMLAYLFGPKLPRWPSVEELNTLRPQDAVKVLRCGDMALASGHWRVLGDIDHFDPAMWPVPQFLRRADALKRAWRVTYSDADPSRSEREESVPYDTQGLEADSLYGYGSTELLLTKLLEAPDHPINQQRS